VNAIISTLVHVWPAVVAAEAGSLAFVAVDARKTLDDLDHERQNAKQVLASCDVDVEGIRRRISELEERAQKLANQRLEVMAMKVAIDSTPAPDSMNGWFNGVIMTVLEERRLRELEVEKRRKENTRIDARTAWLQARREATTAAAEAVRKESIKEEEEREIVLHLKPLRECLAEATQRRMDYDEFASRLAEKIEKTDIDPNTDPVKRLNLLAIQARMEAVQNQFKGQLVLEAEIQRKIIELCEK
jgi:CRISPR/Cas system CSM-associated protein Csm2 small subunit